MQRGKQIYIDYLATTPTDPVVVTAMEPYWTNKFGNPHSRGHAFGLESANAVEEARNKIARLANAQSHNITFTSGATEANNLALKGMAELALRCTHQTKRRILLPPTEHACVLNTARHLQSRHGFRVETIPVNRDGLICPDCLDQRLGDGQDIAFLTVMLANNETGVLQPIAEIAKKCHERGVFFHVDAAQGLGKVPIDVTSTTGLTSMSFSGHKMYGPMGIGALWTHDKLQQNLPPLMHGGGQEQGIRSGTLPTPLAVGFGCAADIAAEEERQGKNTHLAGIRDLFQDFVMQELDGVTVNALNAPRLAGACNMRIYGVNADRLITSLPHLSFSMGSACSTSKKRPSHVLESMGLADLAHECFRVSFGRFSTAEQAEQAAREIVKMAKIIRNENGLTKPLTRTAAHN